MNNPPEDADTKLPVLASAPSTALVRTSLPPLPDVVARSEYDPSLADKTVELKNLLYDRKFWQLAFAFVTFFFNTLFSALFHEKSLTNTQKQRERALKVKELLFDLGPTFIKLGQFLSVRRDILPEEFAEELTALQDRVPPFALDQVRETIRGDLGAPPEDLFVFFDETPIASASIGQVHRVRLKEGGWAVIKVQRPNLAESFYRDLGLMRLMARWWQTASEFLNKLGIKPPAPPQPKNATVKKSGATRHRPLDIKAWLDLSDEFGHTLFSEIDYLKEGKNADRLRKLVRSRPEIRIPRVHWRYTGRHVLTLEYIPGTKISQVDELSAKGFDLEVVGNMLVNCYLEQFVLTGFFHADPHAGNLAIDEYGRLIIYDFGMMGEVSENDRRALLQCVIAVVRRDINLVTKSLMELGIVSPSASMETVSKAISPFIDYYAGRDIMSLDFDNLESEVDQVIAERSFRLPPNLAYLLRAGSSLEGIARTLQPDFSFVNAVRPVMTKWALQQGIESLAKSGRLREFAEFAFKELRASMTPNAAVTNGDGQSSSKFGLPLRGRRPEKTAPEPALPLIVTPQPPAPPAKCARCAQHKSDMTSLSANIRVAMFSGVAYILLSIALSVFYASWASSIYGPLSLYFLIGNSVLGAIIFWKFIGLLKWTSQHSAEVQKSKDDGEK
jgi:predicted unusual protein kinase regulating ubiquinone biosynthesis (AarF/ABC1/UbiB family)